MILMGGRGRKTTTTGESVNDATAGEGVWPFERCRLLYAQMPVSIAISSTVALILAVSLWGAAAPANLGAWLAVFGGAAAGRMALWLAYRRALAGERDSTTWLHRFRVGAFCAGVTWALGAYLLFLPGDISRQAFLAFAIAGICAAAAVAHATDRRSLMLFVSAPLATLVLMFVLEQGALPLSMSAMVALYFGFLAQNAGRSHRWLRNLEGYRRQATERGSQLEKSEARLRHFLSAGPAVIYSCDIAADFPVTFMSPNVAALMGYTAPEFLSVPGFWARNIHPDDAPRARANQRHIMERGSVSQEYRFRHKTGEWRWTRDDQVVIRDATGAPKEIIGAWTDITAQKAAEEASRTQSEFQRIVAEISASLIDARHGTLNEAIDAALRKTGAFFGADRGYVFQFSADRDAIDNTHEWCATGIEPQIHTLQNCPVREIPWHFEQLRHGGILRIPDVEELPAEAATEKREFRRQGIRSLIALPVMREGEFVGFLGFDSVASKRNWSDDEAAQLKVVADIVAGALIRERAVAALADSKATLERRVAERTAALAASELRLRRAQRTAKLGSWEYDLRTLEWHWSDEFHLIFGLDPQAPATLEAWIAAVHPDDRDRVLDALKKGRESHRPQEIQYRIVRPDGQLRVIRARGEEQDGKRVGSVMDVTEQAQAERALADVRRIARLGGWEWNPVTGERWWSAEMYDILGIDPDTFDRNSDDAAAALIHPDDRARAVHTWRQAAPDGTFAQTFRILRPNGAVVVCQERGELLSGDRWAGSLMDITDLVRTQEKLAEAQRIAHLGNWESNIVTGEVRWSDETYRIFGHEPGAIEPTIALVEAHIHADDRERVREVWDAEPAAGELYELHYRIVRPNGEVRTILEIGRPAETKDPQEAIYVGTVLDVTERAHAERNLAQAQRIARTGSWESLPGRAEDIWSDELYRLLGLSRDWDASTDANWDALIHPEDRAGVLAAYAAAYEDRAEYEARYRLVRPDGETRFMVERGEWIDGKFVGTLTDITEQERVQRALEEAQRIAHVGNYESDETTGELRWSDELYRIFGLEPGAIVPTDAWLVAHIHPDDRARVEGAWGAAAARRERLELEYRIVRTDGEVRTLHEVGEPVDKPGGHGLTFVGTALDVTDRARTERSLALAQRIAKIGSWEWLPGTELLRWSEEALRILGYDDGVAVRPNREWQERIHPDDVAGVLATLEANRERGFPFELNYRIVLPSGAVRTIHEKIENEIDGRGELIREVGIFRDITEARQIELAMQALSSELIALEGPAYFEAAVTRLAKLLDVEHAYIARPDRDRPGELRMVALIQDGQMRGNVRFLLAGTPSVELMAARPVLVERGARQRFPGDAALTDMAIEGYVGEPVGDHSGQVIGQIVAMSRRPLPDPATAQTILRMFAVATAAAMGREQTVLRDTWLRAILENAPSQIVLKDLDLRIMAASNCVIAGQKMEPKDMIGKSTRDLLPPEIATIYESVDRKVIVTGEAIEQEVVETDNGKTHYVQNTKFPLRDESGRIIGVCSISTDRTAMKRIEAQLAHAQKMEAVGSLTGGMAHDFNNYLSVIIGNLEMLREDAAKDPRATKLIDAALRGATRSEELTRSLLAFARRQPLAAAVVDVAARIAETAMLLERTLGEDIELTLSVEPDLWPALVDDGQLASAIVNLANNARDAMPGGGRLAISAKNTHVDDLHGPLSLDVVPGDYVMIEVADTGAGMTPEVLANVFEPFFTTKGPGHGTGLGLSMVYGFATQSGGDVRIYSEPGRGTNVRLYLPRADAPAASEAPSSTEALEPSGDATILVVEDNEVVRRTVAAQLVSLGYRVVEAPNGDAAAAILERREHHIDLMLSDVVMPGNLDGYALAEFAQERHPDIRVLLTSGFAGDQFHLKERNAVGPALLPKPYRRKQLAQALRSALAAPAPSENAVKRGKAPTGGTPNREGTE